MGQSLVEQRERELAAMAKGDLPAAKANEPELLVIGMDDGRVQAREKSEETGNRWKENKVSTITRCFKGDGVDKPPGNRPVRWSTNW